MQVFVANACFADTISCCKIALSAQTEPGSQCLVISNRKLKGTTKVFVFSFKVTNTCKDAVKARIWCQTVSGKWIRHNFAKLKPGESVAISVPNGNRGLKIVSLGLEAPDSMFPADPE
ncbi:MAG: hypothetical protein V4543_12515 [Bacteroidota bacterium]